MRGAVRPWWGRGLDALQLGMGWGVMRPLFDALDKLDPQLIESANHERDTNRGGSFISEASALRKALFVAKLLYSYGLDKRARLQQIERRMTNASAHAVRPKPMQGDGAELIFAGDLLYHEQLGAHTLSPALRRRLSRATRLVVNLEGTVAERGHELYPFQSWRGFKQLFDFNQGGGDESTGWAIRFSEQQLGALFAELPPVTFGLANNHSLDDGQTGLRTTLALLKRLGMHYAGYDSKNGATTLLDLGSRRVGILNVGFGQNHGGIEQPCGLLFQAIPYRLSAHTLRARIAALHERGADYIVASLHWGYEHEHLPRDDQLACVEALWAAGCHAVIGHHPHILQPCFGHGGRFVAFSLGDFSGGDRTVFSRYACAVSLRFGTAGPPEIELIPLLQTPYYQHAHTCLLSEAPASERWVFEQLFASKLRSM